MMQMFLQTYQSASALNFSFQPRSCLLFPSFLSIFHWCISHIYGFYNDIFIQVNHAFDYVHPSFLLFHKIETRVFFFYSPGSFITIIISTFVLVDILIRIMWYFFAILI